MNASKQVGEGGGGGGGRGFSSQHTSGYFLYQDVQLELLKRDIKFYTDQLKCVLEKEPTGFALF